MDSDEPGHTGLIRRTRSRHGPCQCSGAADAVQTGELPRNVLAPRMVAKRIRSRMPVDSEHPLHPSARFSRTSSGSHSSWHLFCSSCTLHLGTGRCLHRRCVGTSVLRDCQWVECSCPSCSPPSATPAPWGTRASAARFQPACLNRCQASTPLAKHGLLSSQPSSLASGHSSPKGSRLCIRSGCQRRGGPAGSAFCAGPVARLL
jgi:hypothetical protein